MQDIRIRPALADEAEALNEIAVRATRNDGYGPEAISRMQPALEFSLALLASGLVFAAELEEGRLVGAIGIRPMHWSRLFTLEGLFVEPAFQRRGIGRALFEHGLRRARRLRGAAMLISANPNSEGFYAAMGAIRIGEAPFAYLPRVRLPILAVPIRPEPAAQGPAFEQP